MDLTQEGPTTNFHGFRYFINGVEAWLHRSYSALVTFGDSITDGKGSGHNVNRRYVPPCWSNLLSLLILSSTNLIVT